MEKRNRSDLYRPAEFILNLAPLDSGESIVKMLREGCLLYTSQMHGILGRSVEAFPDIAEILK